MKYETFRDILNETLLGNERAELLERMAKNPERFLGLFRPSLPQDKLLQNIIQHREISFGDAMERVFDGLLEEHGYLVQDRHISPDLECDLYFLSQDGQLAYLVEMKMRDDHDSTKRQGQWQNFEEKVGFLYSRHGALLNAIFYFLDPTFKKNQRFYERKRTELCSDIGLSTIYLWYGQDFFHQIANISDWDSILEYLRRWKEGLRGISILNFETPEAEKDLATIPVSTWRGIVRTEAFWDESFVHTLFPTGEGLRTVARRLEEEEPATARLLQDLIARLYGAR